MIFKKLFDSNEKQIKKLSPIIKEINELESEMQKLTEQQIKEQTNAWKKELKKLSASTQTAYLDEILPKAFAIVRVAALKTVSMRHYDVQLMAGLVLHQGKITEQRTGEGKTLTATLPLYLNSLTGNGAHLVTPNDYLSRHGTGWMGPLYHYLGLKVGVIMQEKAYIYDPTYENHEFKDEYATHLKEVSRKESYLCDITYGTNHEFGFDYLRDNMASALENIVQTNPNGTFGAHTFAIVDEVDSILIDSARTPLIISTTAAQPTERYHQASGIVKQLIKGTDYEVEEKHRNVTLTDLGIRRVEKMLSVKNLYEQDFEMVHLLEQSLTARAIYQKDKDYVVKENQVVIVDQFTGRLLPSNRFSQGLHQAIEAKEGVPIKEESRTIAEISYQNYFRMYKKLAGMTGTAATEAEEFYQIYKLDVVVMPTNRPITRKDHNDIIYKTESAKFKAVADEIAKCNETGQPVLVGTTSVEKSELLHEFLKRRKIPHEILNAKNHEKEALIIAQAGKKGAVTISTNMAGRGVDIILGGDPVDASEQEEIKKIGGLHVIGTERHESRRIDNQLRGRSGRQGDAGSSRFFVSLQDDLMRIFGGAQVEKLMDKFGLQEDVPLEAGLVSKAIENAQKKVEGFNFDRRKYVVEMDDVINVHREVIYKLRRRILAKSLDVDTDNAPTANETKSFEDWFLDKMHAHYDFDEEKSWSKHIKNLGLDHFLNVVSQLSLPVITMLWMEHLVDMDHLREGIGLRGYAQRDPKVEYKRESHEKFELLIEKIYSSIAERISKIEHLEVRDNSGRRLTQNVAYQQANLETGVREEGQLLRDAGGGSVGGNVVAGGGNAASGGAGGGARLGLRVEPVKSGAKKVGRNDPCPCGSGKKFKKCHGR